MICKLCGRDNFKTVDDGKLRCEHCGLYVFIDEGGSVLYCSMNGEPRVEEMIPETSDSAPLTESKEPEKDPNLKPKRSALSQPILTVILTVILLACSVTSCILFKNKYVTPMRYLSDAEKLLAEGDTVGAYVLLNRHKDIPRAKELLSHFVFKTMSKKTLSDDIFFEYYGNGLLKSEINYYSNTNYASYTVYHYDEDQLLIRKELYEFSPISQAVGKLQGYSVFTYNESGLPTSEINVYTDGEVEYVRIYEYDNEGNYVITTDNSGEWYDKNGRLTRKTTPSTDISYEYDENGGCVRITQLNINDPSASTVTERSLDLHSNVLCETVKSIASGEIITQRFYEYTYDQYGNLLVKYKSDNGNRQAMERYGEYYCFYVP